MTYIYAPSPRNVEAVIGHDDWVQVSVNNARATTLPEQIGFHPSRVTFALLRGWNKLSVLIDNRDNTSWRWAGISLALSADHVDLRDLKFSATATN